MVWYFQEERARKLIRQYQARGCVDVELRDEIMSLASDLITGVIRNLNLHRISHVQDSTTQHELHTVGWCSIERSLYKANPDGKRKIYSFWTQIAKNTILAFMKKEKSDIRCADKYARKLNRHHRYSPRLIFEEIITVLEEHAPEEFQYLVPALKDLTSASLYSLVGQWANSFDDNTKAKEDIRLFIMWMKLNRDLFDLDRLNETVASFK